MQGIHAGNKHANNNILVVVLGSVLTCSRVIIKSFVILAPDSELSCLSFSVKCGLSTTEVDGQTGREAEKLF